MDQIAAELIAMADEDARVRAELAADGSLYAGYNPAMRAVHDRNAARLAGILDAVGWPAAGKVGPQAAAAAWIIAMHAIARPDLQRRCRDLLWREAEANRVPPRQAAHMEDRVRAFEGRPQLYGDWTEHGTLGPIGLEDPDNVDARRAEVGLPPLSEQLERMNAGREPMERPPADWEARRREIDEWARSVGWR